MSLKRVAVYVVLIAATLAATVPFLIAILASLKDRTQLLATSPFARPHPWAWGNYLEAWTTGHFGRYFVNSVIVAVPVVVASCFMSILAGFAFARFQFLGSTWLFVILLVGMMVPLIILVIPLFHTLNAMHLLDTYWGLILPQVGLSIPFGTFLMRSFFKGLPQELVEAGLVDGASTWTILWRVLVPLASPAIKAMAVFFSVWTWNDFLIPLVLLPDAPHLWTLPVGLAQFSSERTTDIALVMTGVAIITVPIVVAYLLLQRHFVAGLTQGAVQ